MGRMRVMTRDVNGERGTPRFREVREGQTLADALREEMILRGHRSEDAAAEMGTSSANIARWISRTRPTVPDLRTADSARNVRKLAAYLRVRRLSDLGVLLFNSLMGDDMGGE